MKTLLAISALLTLSSCASFFRPTHAQLAVQHQLRKELVSPGTARFRPLGVQDLGGGRYRVWGIVDSQNRYGAIVQMRYRAVATWYPARERWMFTEWELN